MNFRSRMAILCSCISLPLQRAQSHSAASSEFNKECNDLLPWLQQKSGHQISSALSVGFSVYGRTLFASQSIQAGESILKVPYSSQLTPDKILPEIKSLLRNDVGNVSRLALVVLAEQRFGQDSEWAPYISSLPRIDEMHNTIFWSTDELEMVCESSVHRETINYKVYIEKEFLAVRPALEHFPQLFGDCRLEDFMHAYALVVSRAWRTSKGVVSLVISDRDYVVGEQVLISYGRFPNTTLVLDYGFTLPDNVHDQVEIWIDIPPDDPLHVKKMDLLRQYLLPPLMDPAGFTSLGSYFILKEVKSANGKGKGIPLALRAFARVLSTTSISELKALATEAAEKDGRLARSCLKNRNSEIQGHCILLSQFMDLISGRDAAVKDLQSESSCDLGARHVFRRQMSLDLLKGELRVLRSACGWLTNYCESLSMSNENTS